MFKPILYKTILASILLMVATTASALNNRSFVSTNGSDNNLCTPSSPCRLFSKAISVTSDGGQVVVLDSGGYGALNITKSISLIAPTSVVGGFAISSGTAVTISTPGIKVTLRGLNFTSTTQSLTTGIDILDASGVSIENCSFTGFTIGVHLAPALAGTKVAINDSSFTNNVTAVHLDDNASALINHSRFLDNQNAVILLPTNDGTTVSADLVDTILSGNQYGLYASSVAGPSTSVLFNANHITANDGDNGVVVSGASTFGIISNSNIIGNLNFDLFSDNLATLSSAGNNVTANIGTANGGAIANNGISLIQ